MHVVIAVLNDSQFNQLNQTAIPFVKIPDAVVTELQDIYPNADLADIAQRAFKRVLGEAKIDNFRQTKAAEIEDYRRQVIENLGLNTPGPGKAT
jgi:hypothetical protein